MNDLIKNLLNHEPGFFIWEIIIFASFIIILKKMAYKHLISYLRERQISISDSLASVEKIKMEVYQLKQESEVLRARTKEELTAIQKDTKTYIEIMLLEAEKKAKAEYEFIIGDAMSHIQRLEYHAINDIKSKAGKLIVEIADKVLRKELSEPGEQERYINRLLLKIDLNMDSSAK